MLKLADKPIQNGTKKRFKRKRYVRTIKRTLVDIVGERIRKVKPF